MAFGSQHPIPDEVRAELLADVRRQLTEDYGDEIASMIIEAGADLPLADENHCSCTRRGMSQEQRAEHDGRVAEMRAIFERRLPELGRSSMVSGFRNLGFDEMLKLMQTQGH